ncbi:hypothetical protein [Streptosporangium sp. KLBMP 9127]|nr:hypothetical protein [Streptosporangium sp. KLBMP 9127]
MGHLLQGVEFLAYLLQLQRQLDGDAGQGLVSLAFGSRFRLERRQLFLQHGVLLDGLAYAVADWLLARAWNSSTRALWSP